MRGRTPCCACQAVRELFQRSGIVAPKVHNKRQFAEEHDGIETPDDRSKSSDSHSDDRQIEQEDGRLSFGSRESGESGNDSNDTYGEALDGLKGEDIERC